MYLVVEFLSLFKYKSLDSAFKVQSKNSNYTMVIILDGNSEHVAHAWRKSHSGDCSRSNQPSLTDQKTEIDPYMRTYFSPLVTILPGTI